MYWSMIDPKPIFRRNQASQKVARVLHELCEAGIQTKKELPYKHDQIKVCRKSGGVYVDRVLVAEVTMDQSLTPSLHLVDAEVEKLQLDASELRASVVMLWGNLKRR